MWRRLAAVCTLLVIALPAMAAVVRGPFWSDPATGIAVDGFDPVAYFTDAAPVRGSSEWELRWADAVWRFANFGNLEAFRADPDVYAPRYGGYSALAVAQGRTGRGSPTVWTIRDNQLYLFHSAEARGEWERQPDVWIARADENWPILARTLPR